MPKNTTTTQWPQPGLKHALLDPESSMLMIRPPCLPPEKESNITNLYTHWCSYTSLSWHHKSCHRTQHYRLVCCSYWMSTRHHTHTSDLTAQNRNHGYYILWNTLSQNYKLNKNHDHNKETFSKPFYY